MMKKARHAKEDGGGGVENGEGYEEGTKEGTKQRGTGGKCQGGGTIGADAANACQNSARGTQGISWEATGRFVASRQHKIWGVSTCLLAEQEAIVESIQLLTLRELVGGSNKANEGHLSTGAAVVEETLVEDRQKSVENRRIGLHAAV